MNKLTVLIPFVLILTMHYSCKDASDLNPNNSPTAVFSYSPTNIDTATIVTFDASLSTDIEDPVTALTFSWDLTGKQQWTDASSSATISHMYNEAGVYAVTLKVMDSQGWSNKATKSVIVVDSIQ